MQFTFVNILTFFDALEKEMETHSMATHSNVLAWRVPGMGEPGGLLSMGSQRHNLAGAAGTKIKSKIE